MENFSDWQETLLHLPLFPDGVVMADMLTLPAPLGSFLRRVLRMRQLPLSQLAQLLQLSSEQAAEIGQILVEKGVLQRHVTDAEPEYKVRFAPKSKTRLSDQVWNALGDL
ncbi:MAG: hypothetical protein R3E31_08180 [Chloroflexota bacterium]|nr:hypothetical protein [Anaerolineales bacterium]MCA9975726.1 hypothetical protein [Anaerolineales bacterium]MCB8966908.1 hypothetical protein [Ardenticatenaceae bacterium]